MNEENKVKNSENVAEKLAEKIKKDYPNMEIKQGGCFLTLTPTRTKKKGVKIGSILSRYKEELEKAIRTNSPQLGIFEKVVMARLKEKRDEGGEDGE